MRVNSGLAEHFVKQGLLRGHVRVRDGMCVSALINLNGLDYTMNTVTFGESVRQPLDHKDTAALCTAVSVSRGVKRFALARGTQKVRAVQTKIHLQKKLAFHIYTLRHKKKTRNFDKLTYIWAGDCVGSSDERTSAVPCQDGSRCLVQGDNG